MKKLISIIYFALIANMTLAQNYNINQNQQNININVPVIEKPVYIEKYRTVYIEKPRVAKQLSQPVVILGYLTVFPRDIGYYNFQPHDIISNINRQNLYGKNNWRLPSPQELKLMESYADQIGLGNDIYMATTHANGQLRLVSTGSNLESAESLIESGKAVKVGNLLWSSCNYGASRPGQEGIKVKANDRNSIRIPLGWRLPTYDEFSLLLKQSSFLYICVNQSNYDDRTNVWPVKLSAFTYTESNPFGVLINTSLKYITSQGVISLKFHRGLYRNEIEYWKKNSYKIMVCDPSSSYDRIESSHITDNAYKGDECNVIFVRDL